MAASGRRVTAGASGRRSGGQADGVGLGPLQLLATGEGGGAPGCEDRDRVAVGDDGGDDVEPVVAGGLEHHQGDGVRGGPAPAADARSPWHPPDRASRGREPAPTRRRRPRRGSRRRYRSRRSAYDSSPTGRAGSLGAGVSARACAYEDGATASRYRSSPPHRARAPLSASRTKPPARLGDPLPDPVGHHCAAES